MQAPEAQPACLLPHLPPERVDYAFTDVSLALTAKAKQEFGDYQFVKYGALNIEGEPRRQGFPSRQCDFVVAANVLHATRDVAEALRNAGKLLKPGGLLVLLEMTDSVRWVDLVFGLTQGWWRFTDTRLRPSYPLLSAASWIEVLNKVGFEGAFSVSPEDLPARKVLPQALIVAKAAATS